MLLSSVAFARRAKLLCCEMPSQYRKVHIQNTEPDKIELKPPQKKEFESVLKFLQTYNQATESMNKGKFNLQSVIEIMKKLNVPVSDIDVKLQSDTIIPPKYFDEPLVSCFNTTEEDLFRSFSSDHGEEFVERDLDFRQKLFYQMSLEIENGSHRALPLGDFEKFRESPKTVRNCQEFFFAEAEPLCLKTLNMIMIGWCKQHLDRLKKKKRMKFVQAAFEKKIKNDDLVSHRKRSMVRNINTTYLSKFFSNRLLSTREHAQPLIVDMQFNDHRQNKIHEVIQQMSLLHSTNRQSVIPFRMIHANVNTKDLFGEKLIEVTKTDGRDGLTYETTSKSYLEMDPLIQREQLIYLSPDSTHEMTSFSPQKVYIIGGVVDSTDSNFLTRTTAMKEKIATERLPLDKYLIWGGKSSGRKELSLDVVLKILMTLRDSGSWITALRHIPLRFHRGLSEEGKKLCNFDQKTIDYFQQGQDKYNKKMLYQKNSEVFETNDRIVKKFFGR